MDLYDELEARGLAKQVTDPEIKKVLASRKVTVYVGFDPTAPSLHVGSLLPVITLKRFQMAGHRTIGLVGGATGMIGDPSGKAQERTLLSKERLKENEEGIRKTLGRFLDLKGNNPAKVLNNADWFSGIGYIEFLRDVGKHFTVNYMMAKESVRARLEDREHGISYTEFSYMLLQAYDFLHLHKAEGCDLQVGGSDQWGNITAGCELIRRTLGHEDNEHHVYGVTQPLVTKADGTKFGKTETGNVWLDADRTSPYEFYQFFIQSADADVINYLKYFTFVPLDEIAELEKSVQTDPGKREAQKRLAHEMTLLVHGEEGVKEAEAATQALFGTEIQSLNERTLRSILSGAPSTQKKKSELSGGVALVDLLAETKLCNSKGAARKDLQGGGIYVNNERVSDVAYAITPEHLIASRFVVLRKGKKNYHLVQFD